MCWKVYYEGEYHPFTNPNPVNLQAYFGNADYLESYRQIQEFLLNEEQVQSALLSLQDAAERAGVETPQEFEELLHALELSLGFQGVQHVEGVLHPQQFLAHVRNQLTIDDEGVGERHGRSTHRVQWVLIGRTLQLQVGVALVYASIADVAATEYEPEQLPQGPMEDVLWDALLDREGSVRNGTCPEFLHWSWLRKQNELGLLQKVWR